MSLSLKTIRYYLGYILVIEGVSMLPAFIIAAVSDGVGCAVAFASVISAALLLGLISIRFKPPRQSVNPRGAFITVSLCWIVMSLVGMLPFYISGAIPSLVDCWFETVSGFTTTGASILSNVEALPWSLLYWRSFTHWIGGMGVLVFMIAVMPQEAGSGTSLYLMRAESPGPDVGKLQPTMRNTAMTLYGIYILLTVAEVIFLLAGGMPLFDSVVNSFATAGTGGFSIKNAGVAAYDSAYLKTVIGIFMFIFGTNFGVFYMIITKKIRTLWKDGELRLYVAIMAASTLIITLNIMSNYASFGAALLDGFFQTSSVMTTTGFATADFNTWPLLSRTILVLLMVVGASAGSTGGGIKVSRVIILWKSMSSAIMRMVRPRTVRPVMTDGRLISQDVIRQTNAFMCSYLFLAALSVLVISVDNLDFETSVTAVISGMGNIGPGLGLVGPMGNYSVFSTLSKLVLSFDMLLGRLEIFPLLMLFSPSAWFTRSRQLG